MTESWVNKCPQHCSFIPFIDFKLVPCNLFRPLNIFFPLHSTTKRDIFLKCKSVSYHLSWMIVHYLRDTVWTHIRNFEVIKKSLTKSDEWLSPIQIYSKFCAWGPWSWIDLGSIPLPKFLLKSSSIYHLTNDGNTFQHFW